MKEEDAEYDCLHDEGILYGKKLQQAGANVYINETRGTIHGYDFAINTQIAVSNIEKRILFLKKGFSGKTAMKKFRNQIQILHLIEGARQARGLTVIIDVFRAFSLECYLYNMEVKEIRPVGTLEEAFYLKDTLPDSILIGERHGKKCDGFDYGNSPCSIAREDVAGKTIIHTTSAGTQGIINAKQASEIITGSLVNARAVAAYIIAKQPEQVSLVCMGNEGVRPAAEDELCAEYIKSLLDGSALPNFEQRVAELQFNGGKHFFDSATQDVFPQEDFWMCTKYNQFPFVIQIQEDEYGFIACKKRVLITE